MHDPIAQVRAAIDETESYARPAHQAQARLARRMEAERDEWRTYNPGRGSHTTPAHVLRECADSRKLLDLLANPRGPLALLTQDQVSQILRVLAWPHGIEVPA